MDMKRFLQAVDGAISAPSASSDNEMKRFVSIIAEGRGPQNRLTAAETIAMANFASPASPKTAIATSSGFTQLFKQVESELLESKQQADQVKKQKARHLAERAIKELTGNDPVQSTNHNPEDSVTINVPLLIRIVEYAREDAKTDIDLHSIVEKMLELSEDGKTLTMNDYNTIVGTSNEVDETSDPCWKGYEQVGLKKKTNKTVPNCVPKR